MPLVIWYQHQLKELDNSCVTAVPSPCLPCPAGIYCKQALQGLCTTALLGAVLAHQVVVHSSFVHTSAASAAAALLHQLQSLCYGGPCRLLLLAAAPPAAATSTAASAAAGPAHGIMPAQRSGSGSMILMHGGRICLCFTTPGHVKPHQGGQDQRAMRSLTQGMCYCRMLVRASTCTAVDAASVASLAQQLVHQDHPAHLRPSIHGCWVQGTIWPCRSVQSQQRLLYTPIRGLVMGCMHCVLSVPYMGVLPGPGSPILTAAL